MTVFVNGEPKRTKAGEPELKPTGNISRLPDGEEKTGSLGPLSFFSTLQSSEVVLWGSETIKAADGSETTVYFQKPTPGSQVLRPGVGDWSLLQIKSPKCTDLRDVAESVIGDSCAFQPQYGNILQRLDVLQVFVAKFRDSKLEIDFQCVVIGIKESHNSAQFLNTFDGFVNARGGTERGRISLGRL